MAISPKDVANLTLGNVMSYRMYFKEVEDGGVTVTKEFVAMTCEVKYSDGEVLGNRTFDIEIDDPTWRTDQIVLVQDYALPRANVLLEDELT